MPVRSRACIPSSRTSSTSPLVGFLMEDVALNAELMQDDGIHPNARGNEVILENVWNVLAELL